MEKQALIKSILAGKRAKKALALCACGWCG